MGARAHALIRLLPWRRCGLVRGAAARGGGVARHVSSTSCDDGLPARVVSPAPSALTPAQRRQVDAYLDTLMDWNQRMNLTGEAPGTGESVVRAAVENDAICIAARTAGPKEHWAFPTPIHHKRPPGP